jgi:riboflavin kinase/FMN adenylyltransferase
MMIRFRDTLGPCLTPGGSVVTIGAFDGVHRGHRALLSHVRSRADALGLPAVALTFEPVPRQFFAGKQSFARLSSPGEKCRRIGEFVDGIGLLHFDAALAATSAEAFIERVLVGRLAVRELWVGPGFRFGHARKGDLALLREFGARHGFSAKEAPRIDDAGERISSSRIRELLAAGRFDEAAALLGRRFTMGGHVVHGLQLGRKLGYPTANLRVPWGAPPVTGICAVRVTGAGLEAWPSVASLGTRPTVGGVEPLLEAHLFDFDGDLYGQKLEVDFVAKLRDEARFPNLDAMVEQIHRDAAEARAILS